METGGEKSPPTLLTTMKKTITPKEFDKLIGVNYNRPNKMKKLFLTYWKDFLGCAFLLWAFLMIYIIGAL